MSKFSDLLCTFPDYSAPVKTEDELIKRLQTYQYKIVFNCRFLVFLRQKYRHENEWRYESSILSYNLCDDSWEWDWDWYEGEQHIEFLGFVDMNELENAYMELL